MNHEVCQLASKIDWDSLESDLSGYYSEIGRPAVPIRKIVGLLMLKQFNNLSDELVVARWLENPYWQHFTGEVYFQYEPPFNSTGSISGWLWRSLQETASPVHSSLYRAKLR